MRGMAPSSRLFNRGMAGLYEVLKTKGLTAVSHLSKPYRRRIMESIRISQTHDPIEIWMYVDLMLSLLANLQD